MARTLIAVLSLLLTAVARGDAERWYVLEMQGQRAGWTVERETREGDTIVSTAETRLVIKRGDTAITLTMSTRFAETADGEPIEMTARTDMGGAPTEDRYVFADTGVTWISHSAGAATEKTLPAPEGRWLPPAAAARYLARRLEANAGEITVRTVDPLNGLDPVATVRSGFEHATIEVLGRSVPALRCTARSSLYPDAAGIEYIDEQGRLLRSEVNLGAVSITVIAADEQLAKADLDPPELMRSLFVTPDRPIRDAYTARRATFRLRATKGDLPDIPTTGSQTAERIDGGTVRITRRADATPASDAATDRNACLAPSAMISSDDPRVVELATAAFAGVPDDPAARAEAARRFVHRHIRTKDLSVGFASAAETARTREGDCTEHAVLLAAILRAGGIPSRVVSGLIYADRFAGGRDIFGYHMWTQALLPTGEPGGEGWVDLDATLPDALPRTATHIALGVHTLEGDSRSNALVELAPLMGRLAIAVESVE